MKLLREDLVFSTHSEEVILAVFYVQLFLLMTFAITRFFVVLACGRSAFKLFVRVIFNKQVCLHTH